MVLESVLGFEPHPLVLVVIALLTILLVTSRSSVPANLPPFPAKRLPILGHLLCLGANARETLLEYGRKSDGIFSMYLGKNLVVFLSSYDVLKEALVKKADIFSDRDTEGPFTKLSELYGIIATSGSTWKENRTAAALILKELFAGKDVMSQKILEEVKSYTDELARRGGKASNVKDITGCAVSNVTCNLLYGKRFEYTDPFFLNFIHMMDEFVKYIGGSNLVQWFPILWYVPGDIFGVKSLVKVNAEGMDKVRQLIKMVQDRHNTEEDINSSNLITSYINMLDEQQQSGQNSRLSMKNLERLVFDLMVAGSETSATTLLWFYLYMMHCPDVQEKVHSEIVREIGHRTPTGQDRSRLHYVNAAILETQRLATIVPLAIPHICLEESTLKGFTIPKDAFIFLHLDSALLDEKIWPEPTSFRPERFIKEGKLFCPEQFVPFGLGRRKCMGESLAKMELFLFVVSVVQRFKILPAEPGCLPPRSYLMGSACPPLPYKVRFVERDTS